MYKIDKIKILRPCQNSDIRTSHHEPAGDDVSGTVLAGIDGGDVMKSPCQGCPDRVLGCHGNCCKYIEFRRTHDAARERNRWHEGDYVPIGELKKKSSKFFQRMVKTNKVRER